MESAPKNSSEDFNLEEELDRFSDDLLELEEDAVDHQCNDCKLEFSQVLDLKRHIRKVHQKNLREIEDEVVSRKKSKINNDSTIDLPVVSTSPKSTKPPYPYSCLIALAVRNSLTGTVNVAQIYEFVCKYFPFYKTAPSSWKNSIRHTLNFNKWFKKMEAPNSYNSGAYCDTSNYKYKKRYVWAINPCRILKVDSEIQKWSKMDKNDTLKVIEAKKLESEEDCEINSTINKTLEQDTDLLENKKYKCRTIHDGIKEHQCGLCDNVFGQASHLRNHIENVHKKNLNVDPMEVNDFKCDSCEKIFESIRDLRRHISTIHTDQKEIKCQICDKGLLNTASLNAHIKRVHEKIANYSCDLCEKTFYQSCQLQTHKRVAHEGQRDFECDFCQRAYSTLGNLKKHIQNIHDGMKIHKCNLCNKAFGQSFDLKRHIQNVHEGLKHNKCNYCGQAFTETSNLNRHIRTFHSEFEKIDEFETNIDYFIQPQNDQEIMIDVKPDISNIITVEENHQNTKDPRAKTPPIVVCPTKTLNLYSCTMCGKMFKNEESLKTHTKIHELAVKNVQQQYNGGLNDFDALDEDINMILDDQSSKPKPPYPYSSLIWLALRNSSNGSSPVSEIYDFICEHFPFYRTAPGGWKNSIRHTLNFHKCFKKIEATEELNNEIDMKKHKKRFIWAMKTSKIVKMDSEIKKWSRRDIQAVKNSMTNPDLLTAMEKGELKYNLAKKSQMINNCLQMSMKIQSNSSSKPNVHEDSNDFADPSELEPEISIDESNQILIEHGLINRKRPNKHKCDFCGKLFPQSSALQSHIRFSHEGQKDFECDLCNKAYSTLGNLKKHKSIVHEGLKIHQCHFCSKVFAQSFDLKRHIITVHEGAKNYKCDHCNQRFSQAGNLKQHLNSVHDQSNVLAGINNANHLTSPELNFEETDVLVDVEEISSKNSANEIVMDFEGAGSIHKCQFCRKDFDKPALLKIHIENVHKRGPKRTKTQKCAICDSIFGNKEDLRDHYVENHNEWKQSSLSNKSSVDLDKKLTGDHESNKDQKSIFDHHKQTWNILEGNFIKDQMITTNNDHDLNEDLEISNDLMISNDEEEDVEPLQLVDVTHNDEDVSTDQDDSNNSVFLQNPKLPTQYQCDFCQQFFKTKLDLVQHLNDTHNIQEVEEEREKDLNLAPKVVPESILYKCENCAAAFDEIWKLNQHNLLDHTDLKYQCRLCHKFFSTAASLKSHVKIQHDNAKLHACDICKKTFNTKSDLTRHLVDIHHPEQKTQKCNVCGKTFTRPYQLKNHLLSVHSMYESENENYKQKKSNNQSGFADNSMENEGIDQDNADHRWKKSSAHPSLAFSKTLKQYNEENHVLQTSIIVNYFTEKKVTCIQFMILALSVFPKYIIDWVDTTKIFEGKYLENGCFHIKRPEILAKLWALSTFCANILTNKKMDYVKRRKIAEAMDYLSMTRTVRNYSTRSDMVLSTRTGDSFKNGIPKVWGFTNAFLNLVNFQPKQAQKTILEAVHDKVGTYELRPLLQQVQEGMKLDQDLSKNFGLQPLAHELRLSEKVLKDCNFIKTENVTTLVSNDDIDIKEEICY